MSAAATNITPPTSPNAAPSWRRPLLCPPSTSPNAAEAVIGASSTIVPAVNIAGPPLCPPSPRRRTSPPSMPPRPLPRPLWPLLPPLRANIFALDGPTALSAASVVAAAAAALEVPPLRSP
ncbi:classical arabinogalactan protein 9-like [Ananas comosus]|uniref:Classical arabinogalactan protein 9-like n=1 Tax=Ananas comosus TaxID=4615 RepID=A0A6P5FX43_ANACO|nr:classical arabinogalactan protein 9-like [Ananas comosus]